jgi:anthranilate synthase component 2
MGAALGGQVVRAQVQMHGKASVISTDGRGVYEGLPAQFSVIRYHSLAIERATLPACLEVTATSEDGEIMGVRHRDLAATATPLEGVQFHPESILSEHGHALLQNFVRMGAPVAGAR